MHYNVASLAAGTTGMDSYLVQRRRQYLATLRLEDVPSCRRIPSGILRTFFSAMPCGGAKPGGSPKVAVNLSVQKMAAVHAFPVCSSLISAMHVWLAHRASGPLLVAARCVVRVSGAGITSASSRSPMRQTMRLQQLSGSRPPRIEQAALMLWRLPWHLSLGHSVLVEHPC